MTLFYSLRYGMNDADRLRIERLVREINKDKEPDAAPAAAPAIDYAPAPAVLQHMQFETDEFVGRFAAETFDPTQLDKGAFTSDLVVNEIAKQAGTHMPRGLVLNSRLLGMVFANATGKAALRDAVGLSATLVERCNKLVGDNNFKAEYSRSIAALQLNSRPLVGVIVNVTNIHWIFCVFKNTTVPQTKDSIPHMNMFYYDSLLGLDKEAVAGAVFAARNAMVILIATQIASPAVREAYVIAEKDKKINAVSNAPSQRGGSNNCGFFAALFAVQFLKSIERAGYDIQKTLMATTAEIASETVVAQGALTEPEEVRTWMRESIKVYRQRKAKVK